MQVFCNLLQPIYEHQSIVLRYKQRIGTDNRYSLCTRGVAEQK